MVSQPASSVITDPKSHRQNDAYRPETLRTNSLARGEAGSAPAWRLFAFNFLLILREGFGSCRADL